MTKGSADGGTSAQKLAAQLAEGCLPMLAIRREPEWPKLAAW